MPITGFTPTGGQPFQLNAHPWVTGTDYPQGSVVSLPSTLSAGSIDLYYITKAITGSANAPSSTAGRTDGWKKLAVDGAGTFSIDEWAAGNYDAGEFAIYNNLLYWALQDTSEVPGTGTDWQLIGGAPVVQFFDSTTAAAWPTPDTGAALLVDTSTDRLVGFTNDGVAWSDLFANQQVYVETTAGLNPITGPGQWDDPGDGDVFINRTDGTGWIASYSGTTLTWEPLPGGGPALVVVDDTLRPNSNPTKYGTSRKVGDHAITADAVWTWTDDPTLIPSVQAQALVEARAVGPIAGQWVGSTTTPPTTRTDGSALQDYDYYVNGTRVWSYATSPTPAHWTDTGVDVILPAALPAWYKDLNLNLGSHVVLAEFRDADPSSDHPSKYNQNRKAGDIFLGPTGAYEWMTDLTRAIIQTGNPGIGPLPDWVKITDWDWLQLDANEPPADRSWTTFVEGHQAITPTGVWEYSFNPSRLAQYLVAEGTFALSIVADQTALPTLGVSGQITVTTDTMHAWVYRDAVAATTPGGKGTSAGWYDTGQVIPSRGWVKMISFPATEHLFAGPKDLPTGDPNTDPNLRSGAGRSQGDHLLTDSAVWFWNTDSAFAALYGEPTATQLGRGVPDGSGHLNIDTDLTDIGIDPGHTLAKGDVVVVANQLAPPGTNHAWIYDGSSWVDTGNIYTAPGWVKEFDLASSGAVSGTVKGVIPSRATLPSTPRLGDGWFIQDENHLLIATDVTPGAIVWRPVDTERVTTTNTTTQTPATNPPTGVAKPGDFFVNTADGKVWMWADDPTSPGTDTWVLAVRGTPTTTVSATSGQTPTSNPPVDPLDGDIFVNTNDAASWVYDFASTTWVPLARTPSVTISKTAGDDPRSAPPAQAPLVGDWYVNEVDGFNWIYATGGGGSTPPAAGWEPATPATGNVYVTDTVLAVPENPTGTQTQFRFPPGAVLDEGDRFVNRTAHTSYVYAPDPTNKTQLIWVKIPTDNAATVTTVSKEVPDTPGADETRHVFTRPPKVGDIFANRPDDKMWIRAANPAGAGDIWQLVSHPDNPQFDIQTATGNTPTSVPPLFTPSLGDWYVNRIDHRSWVYSSQPGTSTTPPDWEEVRTKSAPPRVYVTDVMGYHPDGAHWNIKGGERAHINWGRQANDSAMYARWNDPSKQGQDPKVFFDIQANCQEMYVYVDSPGGTGGAGARKSNFFEVFFDAADQAKLFALTGGVYNVMHGPHEGNAASGYLWFNTDGTISVGKGAGVATSRQEEYSMHLVGETDNYKNFPLSKLGLTPADLGVSEPLVGQQSDEYINTGDGRHWVHNGTMWVERGVPRPPSAPAAPVLDVTFSSTAGQGPPP